MSLPVRGAWIEIVMLSVYDGIPKMSLPVRGAWIEIMILTNMNNKIESLPVRGAWIEMIYDKPYFVYQNVAPRAGSVD